jgi:hypothetical protein
LSAEQVVVCANYVYDRCLRTLLQTVHNGQKSMMARKSNHGFWKKLDPMVYGGLFLISVPLHQVKQVRKINDEIWKKIDSMV